MSGFAWQSVVRGERVLYLADDEHFHDVSDWLAGDGLDAEALHASGQLEVGSAVEAYAALFGWPGLANGVRHANGAGGGAP
jgi:KaiC/GvpD/RAD55 family RecA-like ATPase